MGFLPDNFEVASNNNYMKLEEGANKIRVIGEPIIGNVYWTETPEGRRPRRKKLGDPIPMGEVGDEGVKQFVAFVVYNYKAGKVQILEVTQKTVLNAINDYDKNPDWGDVRDYDITINRTGKTKNDTKFTVMPSPKKEVAADIAEVIAKTKVKLDELFAGNDPFKPQEGTPTTQAAPVEDTVNF